MSDGKSRTHRGLIRTMLGLREGVRIALDSIRANIFRASLTILGVAIGVAVVVLMAALITGIRGSVEEEIEAAGPRNFFVTRFDPTDVQLVQTGRPDWMDRPPVTVEEARRVSELTGVSSAVLSIGLSGGMTVSTPDARVSGVGGAGESAEWTDYRRAELVAGRNFVESEVATARSVVVVSAPLAAELFGDVDPVGQRVRASTGSSGTVPLRVVGVIDPGQNIFEGQGLYLAIVPFTTALRRLGASETDGQMIVVPQTDIPLDLAEDQVIGALRSMRGLGPAEANDFSVVRSTQLLEFFDQFTGVFFMVMLALSSVALLVGGVGVVGIMLISVTERTREIGLRKAVGAGRGEILWQFLVEAAVLTVVGGAFGLAIGGGLARAVAAFSPLPAAVPIWAVAAALGMAAFTGMLFGLAPAARAARMEPVAALRHE